MDKVGIRTIVVNFDDEQLPYLSLVQGDAKTRGFDIVICDSDGKEIPPIDDYIVELVATGSNAPDKPYANRHMIKDGKYRVMIPTEALSESGFVFLQLVFYQKSTGAVIHTIEQKCPVYRSRGQEVVESNNLYVDITALRLGIEKIAVMETAYLQVLEDEETRKSAETDRLSYETERKANEEARKNKEIQRQQDEDIRRHSEIIRKSNEIKRENNEDVRIDNESIRKSNESTRQSEEATRKSAEDKRIADEKIRQSNETTRKSQETARESAEDKRVTAEEERKSNETQRIADEEIRAAIARRHRAEEATRKSAEDKRVTAEKEREIKFDSWDKTMQGVIPHAGVIPNATETDTGVVKISALDTEEAPYTVPTIGTFDNAIAVLKSDVAKKQDKLTAGDNIDITRDNISATDTITTINGKTGVISKADITALGIPSKDTVYKKPSSEPISYIQGLQAELDSKVESYGSNPVLNIAVISAGGSTTGIPNNTLILELE